MRRASWLGGGLFALVAMAAATPAPISDEIALATPIGITIQVPAGGEEGNFVNPARYRIHRTKDQYYADANGMALYTYDEDPPHDSSCTEECARQWPPLIAPRGAKPFGEWSLVKRKYGRKQWALGGKPLYRFAKDSEIGKPTGATAPWKLATYKLADIATPPDIEVAEISDAAGEGFVTAAGKTIYVFRGEIAQDGLWCGVVPCASPWHPLQAPRLARSFGDFTVLVRRDGITQWAYKGKGLYLHDDDRKPGDVNGVDLHARWQPALVKRFFVPQQVRIREVMGLGKVFTTADGMSLYRRNGIRAGGLPRDANIMPELGRTIGTRSCDARCTKTWLPLEAPRKAVSTGFWDVVTREDGRKQWAYKGYALYRNANDKKPGDNRGGHVHQVMTNIDIMSETDIEAKVASEVNTYNQITLYWVNMFP